jgi:hypothetical protein
MAINPNELSIHDAVLVETEVEGLPIGLPSFVMNAVDEELWLALRQPDPRLARISEGQRLHLTFDRGGALIVESEFLRRLGGHSRLGSEKSRVFAVRRPQAVDQVQRRAHVRVDLARVIRIKSFGSLGGNGIGVGRTVNVGAGGVQFTTEMPLMFGDQLRVALVLTSHDIVIAAGPVVRIDEIPAPVAPAAESSTGEPEVLTRVAVRFDKIAESDQEKITCHILAAHRRRAPIRKGAAASNASAPGAPDTVPAPGPPADEAPDGALAPVAAEVEAPSERA